MRFTYVPEHDKATEYTLIGDILHNDVHELAFSWPFQRPVKEITLVGLMDAAGNPPKSVSFIREGTGDGRQGYYTIFRTDKKEGPLARVTINNQTKRIATTWEDCGMAVDLRIVCHVLIDTSEPAHDPQPSHNGI